MEPRASAGDHEDIPSSNPKMAPSEHVDHSPSKNAFAELMKPKPKQPPKPVDDRTSRTTAFGRDGLSAYTSDPASFPQSRVVYHDDKFVVINDLYPKATVHLLILPRDAEKNIHRGQEAFEDPVFLNECQEMEKKVRKMVAEELRRKLGKYSATEQPRRDALESDDIPDELPAGRDWDAEVMTGTHANPSMNHLHIHVLSRDLHSECMTKSNHYQSFTTDFLIRMHEYPLKEDDPRRHYRRFPNDMICWRCGKNFGNRMAKLKQHLEDEFEQWRKE